MIKTIKNPILYFFLIISIFTILAVYFWIVNTNTSNISLENGCDNKKAGFITYKVKDPWHKITYCDKQDKDMMKIISEYMPSSTYLSFDYIGNPNGSKTFIYVEDESGHRYVIPDLRVRGNGWTNVVIEVPIELKGKKRIIAIDSSQHTNGWLGIGKVMTVKSLLLKQIPTYLKTFGFILLFSFFISMIFSYFLKKHNALRSYVYMALFLGLSSLISFIIYWYSLKSGEYLSWLVCIFVVYNFFRLDNKTKYTTFILWGLLFSLMMVILFIGYSNLDDLHNMEAISANRWHHLPIDNWIPKFFADGILRGHVPSPLVGNWLSSDRPPLQTGFFLLFSIFSHSDLNYLVTTVGMQLLVIIFVILFLVEYTKDRKYVYFVSLLIFFNGFVFVHSLFVWPKLLSALYQGIAFYYVYTIYLSKNHHVKDFILFGSSATLAFLAHGGSVFFLLSLAILLLVVIQNKKDIKALFYGFFASLLLYIPWVLYQKLVDPPGDRLLKWHLAGRNDPTAETFLQVLSEYYDKLTFSDWIIHQLEHFKRIFYSFYINLPHIDTLTRNKFLDNTFFSFDYSYLFYSIFLVPLLYFWVKPKLDNNRLLFRLLISSYLLTSIIWSLILTRGTVIHQGSYFMWFIAMIATTLVVYIFNRYIFYLLGLLNLAIFIYIYLIPYLFHDDMVCSFIVIGAMALYLSTLRVLVSTKYGKVNASK